jgi:hypothetical protein
MHYYVLLSRKFESLGLSLQEYESLVSLTKSFKNYPIITFSLHFSISSNMWLLFARNIVCAWYICIDEFLLSSNLKLRVSFIKCHFIWLATDGRRWILSLAFCVCVYMCASSLTRWREILLLQELMEGIINIPHFPLLLLLLSAILLSFP